MKTPFRLRFAKLMLISGCCLFLFKKGKSQIVLTIPEISVILSNEPGFVVLDLFLSVCLCNEKVFIILLMII